MVNLEIDIAEYWRELTGAPLPQRGCRACRWQRSGFRRPWQPVQEYGEYFEVNPSALGGRAHLERSGASDQLVGELRLVLLQSSGVCQTGSMTGTITEDSQTGTRRRPEIGKSRHRTKKTWCTLESEEEGYE